MKNKKKYAIKREINFLGDTIKRIQNNHKFFQCNVKMYELSQKELANFLMFSTGTSRVPFGGFAALESNRGNLSKFMIERTDYQFGEKNFIKAHTCFNRLDIPEFESEEEMKDAIKFISSSEIIGFGIE